jgi:hypothetical protein
LNFDVAQCVENSSTPAEVSTILNFKCEYVNARCKSIELGKVKLSRYMPWRHMGGEEV